MADLLLLLSQMAMNEIDNGQEGHTHTNQNPTQHINPFRTPVNQRPPTMALNLVQQATGNNPNWTPAGNSPQLETKQGMCMATPLEATVGPLALAAT